MKIIIGSDHGGVNLKKEIIDIIENAGHEITDTGIYDETSVDYPDIAKNACQTYFTGKFDRGILICGTGIGISITANKYPGIRCALIHNCFTAQMAIEHNHAHFIAMGGRIKYPEPVKEIIQTWLNAKPDNSERHKRRVDKIMETVS